MTDTRKKASDSWLTRAWKNPENRNVFISIALVILEIVLFGLLKDNFLKVRNLRNIMRQMAELGLITIPITMIMITGNIDQSVGAIMGFTATVMGVMMKYWGWHFTLAIPAGLVLGAICGAVNGVLVANMKLQ